MIKCPFCAEEIQENAIKCKHCGEWFKNANADKVSSEEYVCDKCEAPVLPDEIICSKCGNDVRAVSETGIKTQEQPIAEAKNSQKKEVSTKAIIITVAVASIVIGIIGSNLNGNTTPSNKSVQEAKKEANIAYEIVKKDVYDATSDYVKKAKAEKQGAWKTITNMPLFKEEKLRVLISSGLDENTVKEIMRKIYKDELESDDKLKRITVTAYNNREYVETNANYVAHSYWEGEEFSQTKDVKDNKDIVAGGQITWAYINVGSDKDFIPASEVSDQERKIFYRYWYWESHSNFPTLAFSDKEGMEKQNQAVYEKVGKDFSLVSNEVNVIVDKVSKSVPSDYEKRVSDAVEKRLNARLDRGELSSKAKDEIDMSAVAKEFKISADDVNAIWIHVELLWRIPTNN